MADRKDGAVSSLTGDELVAALGTDPVRGLSADEVLRRQSEYGPNELSTRKTNDNLVLAIRQFQSSVVLLLLGAAIISFWTGETLQAAGILAAVIINALVGFVTELRASISLKALEDLTGPTARVRRGGADQIVAARDLVPGDLVVLEAGSRIPADLHLVDAVSLSVDESPMTGESVPVYKSQHQEKDGDSQSCRVFQGTLCLQGRGLGVVTATGNHTRMGKLGVLLAQTIAKRTPLEERLEDLGRQLSYLTLAVCALTALIGVYHRQDVWHMLETSIALAVAAIPEGMPVVATLALAVGTNRMVRARALLRELAAVETLGCTTVICTDKTGTLTENRMMVSDLVFDGRHLQLTGNGYEPVGSVLEEGCACSLDDRLLVDLLRAACLCNDARIEFHEDDELWHVHGDPTEGALITAAGKAGLNHDETINSYPRVGEIPFDLSRKRMTTLHRGAKGEFIVFVKGSPESVLSLSTRMQTARGAVALDAEKLAWLNEENEGMARAGLRVLAVASRLLPALPEVLDAASIERDLTLIGLVGMSDRPRQGVEEAIASCQEAGIRVVMLTGDQSATAESIARQLGIAGQGGSAVRVVEGRQLEEMSADEQRAALESVQVLARVSPESKLSIVRLLQGQGQVVAMTGDGVNDAPALRQSDIGVAMGRAGTDLAREAANMVITDDSFSTIVKAVEQGRIIYGNIKRSICYLLTASLASVVTIAGAVAGNLTLPLLPLQLLWLNLIMHVFPGLGIVLQRGDKGVMRQKPRDRAERLIMRGDQVEIAVRALAVSAAALLAIEIYREGGGDPAKVTTVGFATLSAGLLFQALDWARMGRTRGFISPTAVASPSLVLNMAISYLLMFVAIYWPPLQAILDTRALTLGELALVASASTLSFVVTVILSLSAEFLLTVFRKRALTGGR